MALQDFEIIPIYVTLIRLLVPFLILKWPLWGILAASLADMYDWRFVNVNSPESLAYYHGWDKAMDLYYWVFAVWFVIKWKDKLAQKFALFFFSLRVAGIGFLWLTGIRPSLFFFPNIFENFFIFYMAYVYFTKKDLLFTSFRRIAAVLISLAIPKLVHEYFMHYLEKQPWEIYNVGEWLGYNGILQEYTNYAVWGSLFYSAPVIIFLLIKNKRI